MKKIAFLGLASMALVGGVFAQAKVKVKPAKTPTQISCAVMKGDMVDIVKSTKSKSFADYKGRRYFFCCPHCIGQFKADPSKFSKSSSIATPKK